MFFATRDDVRLNGWFIPHREARSTLVWFHGNAGNISHRVENIKLLHDKVKINIFIFDYRGYGRSEGRVSEEGTYLDGEAALDYVRERLDVKPKKIVLFGRSLGAAVAAHRGAQQRDRLCRFPDISVNAAEQCIGVSKGSIELDRLSQ